MANILGPDASSVPGSLEWAHHIKQIEVHPQGEPGPQSSGVIHLANGIKSTFRMTEFNSKER